MSIVMEKPLQYYKELLGRYIEDQCTPEEVEVLMKFLSDSRSNRMLLSEMKNQYAKTADSDGAELPLLRSKQIKALLLRNIQAAESEKPRTVKWKMFFSAAAALLIMCVAGYWLYYNNQAQRYGGKAVAEGLRTINPGTKKAVLHFSDGLTIKLDTATKGLLYDKNGLTIFKTELGEIKYAISGNKEQQAALQNLTHTLTTPTGGECSVILADGSKIWLNARSSIRFPIAFSKTERRMEAQGEVYFEVAKNKTRPFKVISGKQSIEVLGTHFLVNTNADNSVIKTTLLEGRIRLSNGKVRKIMEAGQESKYTAAQADIVVTHKENAAAVAAWKDGYFVFDNTDFKTMQEQISKWYAVEFVYDQLPDKLFYGKIARTETLSKVLEMLEIVSNLHFKIEGRNIYVTES